MFTRQPAAYVAQKLRKDRLEINVKKLTPEQQEKVTAAKWIEVQDWLAEKGVAKLPPHLRPEPAELMKTRWVLTWKGDGEGDQRAIWIKQQKNMNEQKGNEPQEPGTAHISALHSQIIEPKIGTKVNGSK